MKNKEFHKLLKHRAISNSGFTLYELLVGLVMGTIVVGALGFGLTRMLTTTLDEETKGNTRSETARAFSFIADEVKAAQSIDVDSSLATLNPIVPRYSNNLPAGSIPRLALNVPGVSQKIIYSVAPAPVSAAWNGPSVIYRWGPNFNATGGYTDPDDTSTWQHEALIDGVDNTNQVAICDANGDGTAEQVNYQGFYACVVDDDGDFDAAGNPILENLTDSNGDGIIDSADGADLNGDGEVNADDSADTDGTSITAQLYFVGQSNGDVHRLDSQVVARSRVAPLRKPELQEPEPVFFTSLQDRYGRLINDNEDTPCWTVRNDFGAGSDPTALPDTTNALENTMTWVHEDNRQPQPLNIDRSKPFTMVASAFGGLNSQCIAKGNRHKMEWNAANNQYEYTDSSGAFIADQTDETNRVAANGSEKINTYQEKVWHTIEFDNEATFNGVDGAAHDNPDVAGDGSVYMFRNDSTIPDIGGYDANNNGVLDSGDQPSLRKVLQDKGIVDSNGNIIDGKLEPNQRIVVFEIGQDRPEAGVDNPGYDLQDSMFIMTFDEFAFTS